MKILELLNKHIKIFFIVCLFFSYSAISEEPVDIWNIDPKKITENNNKKKKQLKIVLKILFMKCKVKKLMIRKL